MRYSEISRLDEFSTSWHRWDGSSPTGPALSPGRKVDVKFRDGHSLLRQNPAVINWAMSASGKSVMDVVEFRINQD